MSKPLKSMITDELKKRYQGVNDACVVSLSGLNVEDTQTLRRDLDSKAMQVHVIRNSLARRAFAGGPLEGLAKRLVGPCALVTGGDSVIEVAKTLVHWAKSLKNIELKVASLDGDADFTVEQVSQLKTRLEVLGDVAMLVASPGRALAGCIGSPGGKIAGCLKTLADREAAA
jgi:large subunit ribosomal protein L10